MLINNFIFSEHSGFMHIAKFNCTCLKMLKTGPAMAGLAGPTPTACLPVISPIESKFNFRFYDL